MNLTDRDVWFAFETLAIFLSALCLKTQGIHVALHSIRDCNRTFDLNKDTEVNINYLDGINDDCKIIFNGSDDSDYPRICVKAENLDFGGCAVEVEVHHWLIIEGHEDQQFSCSSSENTDPCTYLDEVTVIFKRLSSISSGGHIDIQLKVYAEKSGFRSGSGSGSGRPGWITIVSIIVGVLSVVIFILRLWCRLRASQSRAAEYRAPQQQFSQCPAVQYQAGNQSEAGYQQPATGYPPSQPASEYPLQTQGSVHPQTELHSVDHEAYREDRFENQNTPLASTTGGFSSPPPTYQEALEMDKREAI